jgi:hypothetical protein
MDNETGSKIARDPDPEYRKREEQERALDQALEETFPGSDPVNVIQPPQSPQERRNEKSDRHGGRSA